MGGFLSLFGSPALTSKVPIPKLHHPVPQRSLGSPQDVPQEPQTAHVQARHSPFSPDPISLCLLPQVPGPEPLNPSVHCTLSFPRCLVGHQILLMTEPKPTSGQSQLPTCQLEAWPLLRPSASVLWPGWSQQPPTLLMAASVHTRPGVPFPKMIRASRHPPAQRPLPGAHR